MSLKSADNWFSKFIRIRDADEDGIIHCISCPKEVHWTKADCGHFVKRQHKALRYSEINCNGQCKECNWLKQGNDIEYAKGLDVKYGTGTAESLLALARNTFHLGKFELKVIADHYKEKFENLKKEKGL
jgi:hypothetical protein